MQKWIGNPQARVLPGVALDLREIAESLSQNARGPRCKVRYLGTCNHTIERIPCNALEYNGIGEGFESRPLRSCSETTEVCNVL